MTTGIRTIMEFEWDEEKRLQTLEDRALDFADAYLFFDGRPVVVTPSPQKDEERWRITAEIEDRYYTLVWTWREDVIRIISLRRAHESEEKAHRALHD